MILPTKWFRKCLIAALLGGTVLLAPMPGDAQGIETAAREAMVMDFETGKGLLHKNGDESMPPASMSKLMTVYILFEHLKDGRLKFDDKFRVSENAWRKGGAKSGGSTMFLNPGDRVGVEDLIHGIIVQSGNDACIVVAEALSGTEDNFAIEMTAKARELGMANTTFKNATGWPDPNHRTTARDLAILAMRTIRDFPDYYDRFYHDTVFTYNGIRQSNRNPLLYKNIGADGLKTGHTREAGYGLTASVKRDERRLIAVVNGLDSKKARSAESERLIEWGFREFENYALFTSGDVVETADVWLGMAPSVPLVVQRDVIATMTRKARDKMKVVVTYEGPLKAPIVKGQKVADAMITSPETNPVVIPLVAGRDVPRLGFMGRVGAALSNIFWGSSS